MHSAIFRPLRVLQALLVLLTLGFPAHTRADLAAACPGYSLSAAAPEQITALASCLEQKDLPLELQFAARKKRGMLLLQFLRPLEARHEFSEALKINRQDPECYQGLAIVYQFLGKKAEANAYQQMALELRQAP